MKLIAKTSFGLEQLLSEEIAAYGGTNIEIGIRAVTFEGDKETLYKLNLWSRTALRILKPIMTFAAHDEVVLYKRLRRYDWTKLMRLDQTFMITSVVSGEYFNHSQYISYKTKDAIVDLFRLKYDQERPNINLKNADFVIDVHCRGKDFTVSLDSSGKSLHRRGYRQSQRQAPLNETLAAGMLMLSNWDGASPLLDPMCGSGTILTEAYMIVKNIPPRQYWDHFGFMNWDDYDDELWQKIKREAHEAKKDACPSLVGYEIDQQQAWETQDLMKEMELDGIDIRHGDFIEEDKPFEEGTMITNPPYGLRIGEEDEMEEFYKEIGDKLKQSYAGYTAWIISGNKQAMKRIGLRTTKKLTLFNGAIECKYHRYDLYRGSNKVKKEVAE